MHQLILLTAMTATSGLFGGGGGRHCGGGHCGRQTRTACYSAPACAPQSYGYQQYPQYQQPCAPCGAQASYAPAPQYAPAPTPQYAPAPAPQYAPAPAKSAPQASNYYNPASYFYYPAAPSCPTGNCPNAR